MASEVIQFSLNDKVAVLRFDDGKANALSPTSIAAFNAALDRAEREARAVLLIGRAKRFSAGFDLSVMRTGPDAVRQLVGAGADLLLRLYTYPLPTVAACSGHALAAGALLLLSADTRIGVRGDFKIGLNEVQIGMQLPVFAIELARDRVGRQHFHAATTQARLYDPDEAVEVGFLDRAVSLEELEPEALKEARTLAELHPGAYAGSKKSARSALEAQLRSGLEDDLMLLVGAAG